MTDLEELRAGGRLVATGTFDLDPARAREKLARYQLVDPHRYVLQFVQAAELLGATKLTADIDADEVRMVFDGSSPTAAELEEIYLHAFGRRGVARLEALRHLALGVIAAESVDPAVVRFAGSGGTLTIRDGAEAVQADETSARNEVYVRERARLGHLLEFLKTFRGRSAEEVALDEARFARLQIVVNRRAINRSPKVPRTAVEVATEQESGHVWVESAAATLTLVQHGVVVERVTLDIGSLSVTGVLHTTRLSTNLAQSAFVRNHAWDELIETVLIPAALQAADRHLSRQLRTANRELVAAMLATALRNRDAFARRAEPVEAVDELVMRWADVAVWRRVANRVSESRHATTQELLGSSGTGPLFVSQLDEPFDVLRYRGEVIEHVLLAGRNRDRLNPFDLASATNREVVDVTESIRQDVLARSGESGHARDGLVASGGRLRIDRDKWVHVEAVERAKVRVELGVPATRIRHSASAIVVVEDDVVLRTTVDIPLLGSCALLIATDGGTDEPPSELLRSAAPVVLRATTELLNTRCDALPPDLLIDLLYAVATHSLADEIYSDLGWPAAPKSAERVGIEQVIDWTCGDVPLFAEVASAAKHSIRSLSERRRVPFIRASSRRRALQIAWELSITGTVEPIVWLGERERAILHTAVGADALVDVEQDVRSAAARIHHERAGLAEEPVLHGSFIRNVKLDGPQVRGEVGLVSVHANTSFIELVILHRGKRLAHRELPADTGQFRAIVETERLTPTPDMTDVVDDEALEELTKRLTTVCTELFEGWCSRQLDHPEQLSEVDRLALWNAVAVSTDTRSAHRRGWSVFPTTDGELSADGVRARTGGQLRVCAEPVGDELTVLVPPASGQHLALLRRVFSDLRVERVDTKRSPPRSTASEQHSLPPPQVDDLDEPVQALRAVGVAVDRLQVIEDSGLAPQLRERCMTVGASHPLHVHASSHPRWVVACVLAISADREVLTRAVSKLTA